MKELTSPKKCLRKKSKEKILLQQLKEGRLKFALHGSKLKGGFALVKAHGRADNSWLLIKHKDKYASTDDITKKDKSVISKKSLMQIADTSKNVYKSNRAADKTASKKATPKKNIRKISDKTRRDIAALLAKGRKSPLPGCETDACDAGRSAI